MDLIVNSTRAQQKLYMIHVHVSFYDVDNVLYIALENIRHVGSIACIIQEVADMDRVQVWCRWHTKWVLMFKR